MPKQATTRTPTPSERRSGDDRRRIEGAPPGKHDRRRGLEPRLPEVVELDMTIEDGRVSTYRAKVKISFKHEGSQ